MRFYGFFIFVACLASSVMADTYGTTPLAASEVYVCEHTGFGGACRHLGAPLGACQNIPADFNHKVSAVQPNQAAGVCRFYDDFNCEGNSFISAYPGVSNIPQVYPSFNDRVISFQCI
ncbi:uncharacterized protein TRIVIDRAFT_111642 [Trichoderma virens Gv29-8]|uniref:Uncharacterized protein n=1 Tax=Hypocrea virens (strain Gv29-8 / FGSC 10586) TaxID=413071 RepID=G9MQ28_HYPVG|nr:uncharacterized protein TRIVIDRAFT_111642 [Trichoderma virens Gv29-8]EHK23977.1 hypothetical protein TRIVIDRAFT_111642 [Trichoderma virens Gv29-8]UKZ50285.1 hypothetical protein TrVGV298_004542 [Trichoderma virens]